MFQLVDNPQCDHRQQAISLRNNVRNIAHMQVFFTIRVAWVAEVVESLYLLVGHGFNFAAQFQRQQRYSMHDGEYFWLTAGYHTLLHHAQDHHIDQYCFLGDVIGGEEFNLRLVREAWPQLPKRGIEQGSIVDYTGGIDSAFRT